ncbi:vesicular glutamate transporter 1-like [Branchiostoma floridae x Branchiostoma japonicum]
MADEPSTEPITTPNKLLCVLLFSGILFQYAGRTSVSVVLVELQVPPDNNTNINVTKSTVQYSQFQVGVILSSVYIGLLPSSFLGGYLAYRYPAVRVLLASVGLSSVVHSVAPFVFQHFEAAVAHRVVAGLAEGLCEPAAYGVLSERLLQAQSAKVSPFVFAGLYLGQFLGIIATGFITQRLLWQAPFYFFGGLGITWTVVMVGFEAMTKRKNKDVDKTNEKDENKKKSMKSIPLCHILTSPAVWASILLQIAAYCWEPNILPLYFNQSFGASIELVGVLAGIPVLVFGALEPLFALVGNRLSKRFSTTIARKVLAVTGCLGVSGCLLVAAFTPNSVVAACFVSVAYGSSAARAAVADANPFDIAPRYASVLCGICRVLCRVVGITFPLLVTTLTKNKTSQEWSRVVLIIACVFAATALFYGVFGSGEEQHWATARSHGEHSDIQDGAMTVKQNGECRDRMPPITCASTQSTWL